MKFIRELRESCDSREYSGTSGVITPFCKTEGLYFVDRTEPEEFQFNFDKEVNKLKESEGIMALDLYNTMDDFYRADEKIREVNSKFKVTEKSDMLIIKIDLDDDSI